MCHCIWKTKPEIEMSPHLYECMKRVSRRRNTLPNFTQLSARPSTILAFTSRFIWSSICLHYAFFLRVYLTRMALHHTHACAQRHAHALSQFHHFFTLRFEFKTNQKWFYFHILEFNLLICGGGWVAEGLQFADALENLPLFLIYFFLFLQSNTFLSGMLLYGRNSYQLYSS